MSGDGPSRFLPTAIETVKKAIAKDDEKQYEEAFNLYQAALERFVTAMKYEKNPSRKKVLAKRIDGYMKRAEQLRVYLDKVEKQEEEASAASPAAVADGGAKKDGAGKEDEYQSKLYAQLSEIVVADKPNVPWNKVAGLEAAKAALQEAVILPMRFPSLFQGNRKPWSGILLYGPPGTGKSYLAAAVATECDATFLNVASSNLVSKWQGESEKLVKTMFQMAREKGPSVIFIDEIDSLCSARGSGENESSRRIKTEFLIQMQGVGKTREGLLVLGATNVPWEIDSAMRRRFEKRIYIPLPSRYARAYMFHLNLGDTPHDLGEFTWELVDPQNPDGERRCTNQIFNELADATEGFSGSDISVVVREAMMDPVRECQRSKHFRQDQFGKWHPCLAHDEGSVAMTLLDIKGDNLAVPQVMRRHFESALTRSHTSVGVDELTKYTEWTEEFGEEGA